MNKIKQANVCGQDSSQNLFQNSIGYFSQYHFLEEPMIPLAIHFLHVSND